MASVASANYSCFMTHYAVTESSEIHQMPAGIDKSTLTTSHNTHYFLDEDTFEFIGMDEPPASVRSFILKGRWDEDNGEWLIDEFGNALPPSNLAIAEYA